MTRMKQFALFAVTMALIGSYAPAWAKDKPAIIWAVGQNTPNWIYWKDHGTELEEMLPFDGVNLEIYKPPPTVGSLYAPDSLGAKVFQEGNRFTAEMAQPFVRNMKSAGPKSLKQNLVMVNVMCRPNPLNYFDDSRWDDILNNIRIVAGAAKEIGCAVLIIDPEQYAGSSCFYYPRLIEFLGEDKPWAEVVVKVRERGRQFGQALSAVFPDCKILFLFGHAWVLGVVEAAELKGDHSGLEGFGYLYPAFLDGMLEGTSEGTIFIEGMEQAYSYTTARQFREGSNRRSKEHSS